jgi:hypothetical protein
MKRLKPYQPIPFTPPPIPWDTVQSFKKAGEWYLYQSDKEKESMPINVQLAFQALCEMTNVKLPELMQ